MFMAGLYTGTFALSSDAPEYFANFTIFELTVKKTLF